MFAFNFWGHALYAFIKGINKKVFEILGSSSTSAIMNFIM